MCPLSPSLLLFSNALSSQVFYEQQTKEQLRNEMKKLREKAAKHEQTEQRHERKQNRLKEQIETMRREKDALQTQVAKASSRARELKTAHGQTNAYLEKKMNEVRQ